MVMHDRLRLVRLGHDSARTLQRRGSGSEERKTGRRRVRRQACMRGAAAAAEEATTLETHHLDVDNRCFSNTYR